MLLRHRRHKQGSRLLHHGNIAAAGLYPVVDESDVIAGKGGGSADKEEDITSQQNGVHEIQGVEVPAYSRELAGSAGVGRQEVPGRL